MAQEHDEQGTIRYIRCPACGMPNPASSETCSRCGDSLQTAGAGAAAPPKAKPAAPKAEIPCPKCGKALPAGSKFCGFCGTPLPAAKPAPEVPHAKEPAAAPKATPAAPAKSSAKPASPAPPRASAPPAPKPSPAPAELPRKPAPAASPAPEPAAEEAVQGTQVFAGLQPGRKVDAFLVEIKSDDSRGKTLRVTKETFIGRGTCDASYPDDALLSARHAAVRKSEGRVYLRDLESVNGTFLKQRQDVELKPGDVFVLGRQIFRFTTERLNEPAAGVQGTVVMGGAPKLQPGPVSARLEHIHLSGEVIEEYSLDRPETTLGRVKGDLIFGDDPYMSGTHARIIAQPGRFILRDLKSRNGIYRRIRGEVELTHGDEFFLGEQRFRAEIQVLKE